MVVDGPLRQPFSDYMRDTEAALGLPSKHETHRDFLEVEAHETFSHSFFQKICLFGFQDFASQLHKKLK